MISNEIPGEGKRPPFGALHFDNAKEGLKLLLTAHAAYYTAQTALIQLKVALAQRVIEQAEHLHSQVHATQDIHTKVDLVHQADALHSKVVTILFNLLPPDDDTLSSIAKTNVN